MMQELLSRVYSALDRSECQLRPTDISLNLASYLLQPRTEN